MTMEREADLAFMDGPDVLYFSGDPLAAIGSLAQLEVK